MKKYLPWFLSGTLLAGTIFAWYTVVNNFLRFYRFEGTVFKVSDCITPNPVTTACFYGAFAFAGGFIWSLIIPRLETVWREKQEKFMVWFLAGGVVFAWTNFFLTLARFLTHKGVGAAVGCSGEAVSNPLNTPCFIGSSLFLLAFVSGLAVFAWRAGKKY